MRLGKGLTAHLAELRQLRSSSAVLPITPHVSTTSFAGPPRLVKHRRVVVPAPSVVEAAPTQVAAPVEVKPDSDKTPWSTFVPFQKLLLLDSGSLTVVQMMPRILPAGPARRARLLVRLLNATGTLKPTQQTTLDKLFTEFTEQEIVRILSESDEFCPVTLPPHWRFADPSES